MIVATSQSRSGLVINLLWTTLRYNAIGRDCLFIRLTIFMDENSQRVTSISNHFVKYYGIQAPSTSKIAKVWPVKTDG